MSDLNQKKDEAFDRRVVQTDASVGRDKQRLERVYNEDEPNLIKLRQDVANAIVVERQLEQQLKNRKRKQFDNPVEDPEVAILESKLSSHREVKEQLKDQLTEREQRLEKIYDDKPGLIHSFVKEPKNVFAAIVLMVIAAVLYKILLP